MRLIDADAYAAEMKKRQDACMEAMENDSYEGEQFSPKEHWEGVLAAFAEAKLTLDDMPTIGGWISVKDRLPEISGHYLVSCVTNKTGHRWEVSVNAEWLTSRHEWYIETENCLATAAGVIVTHYMPLPEPPKEDKNVD